MDTMTMKQELATTWLHVDDFTACPIHEVCHRATFFPGGQPEAFPGA